MVYPRNIDWHGGSSAHTQPRPLASQRALVQASLLARPATTVRWDERTGCAYRTPVRR